MDYKKEVLRLRQEREQKRRQKKQRQIIVMLLLSFLLILIGIFVLVVNKNFQGGNNTEAQIEITPEPQLQLEAEITPEPTEEPTPEPEPTEETIERRGSAQPIPQEVRDMMAGKSMPSGASVSYDDLMYLTIPHYDFSYNVTVGHMVVNRAVAEEVLDIFAELFDVRYPIERMELVDNYGADDYTSIEHNNTSAFNYRESTDGSGRLSKHALGRAIDINPQINPYVNSSGSGSHSNAREYWSRDVSSWSSDIAKAAYIGPGTEIYRIFVNEHGWEWGGSWSSYRDYQHFQKTS